MNVSHALLTHSNRVLARRAKNSLIETADKNWLYRNKIIKRLRSFHNFHSGVHRFPVQPGTQGSGINSLIVCNLKICSQAWIYNLILVQKKRKKGSQIDKSS